MAIASNQKFSPNFEAEGRIKIVAVSQFLLHSVLEERFGLQSFRPKQSEVIESVLSGTNTLALLPTGYGKSLCYQVPSQILSGMTIVVSPLIALMQDQMTALYRNGVRNATALNSSLSQYDLESRIWRLEQGEIKLLYLAPERFESPRFRKLLPQLNISLVVIDEAHCISQWGHDFRLQYRNLSAYLAQLTEATVLALTATATPFVQRDIIQTLGVPRMKTISASFDRPNLRFEAKNVKSSADKETLLLERLRGNSDTAIIYTSSRKETERLAALLNASGITSGYYHAGLDAGSRQKTQFDFQNGKFRTIVCTVAFGMGIDKSDIRQVIHFNLPSSLESYYQEAGRAGRDGNHARCLLLHQAKDISTQKWLLGQNYPSPDELRMIFSSVKSRGITGIKPQELANLLSLKEPAVQSGLNYLKQIQVLDSAADGSFFDRCGDTSLIDFDGIDKRKKMDLDRLQKIVDYVSVDSCRREHILDYFGQTLQDGCSGCDVCNN